MLIEHLFSNREELFERTAQRCQQLLQSGLAKNATASFVVPGGTTPAPVFEHLSKQSLDWKNIQIALSDERWLDASHEQSNQKLIENSLLINNARAAQFFTMKNNHETAKSGEEDCNNNFKQLHFPIDVVMLGMGPDGHFASLFPHTEQIQQALDLESTKLCMAIDAKGCEVAGAHTQRMSLTLSALTNSKAIILLFTGEEKLQVLHDAKDAGDLSNLPVSALINQNRSPIEVYWAP